MFLKLLCCSMLLAPALAAADFVFPSPQALPVQPGLADPFVQPNGERIRSKQQWPAQREYLKAMMGYYQYGRMPPKPQHVELTLRERTQILGGKAVRERWTLTLTRGTKSAAVRFGVVRPARPGRFPVVVKNDAWVFDITDIENESRRQGYIDQKRPEVAQAVFAEAVKRGYAIVKFLRTDVAADQPDNRRTGVFPLYPEPEYDWGTIAAWAWIYQPLIDWLETTDWADAERTVATGHSRSGKTALCAGIYDERVAITAPSASGSGGTGSWRYFTQGGRHQDVASMTGSQPHWFTPRLTAFANLEPRLPFGSHTAKALIAPRGLFNTQGADDRLSNPVGTQATFQAAQVVFQWLGANRNQDLHFRPGGHMQSLEDWLALFDFSDQYFFGKSTKRNLAYLPNPDQPTPFEWAAPVQPAPSP